MTVIKRADRLVFLDIPRPESSHFQGDHKNKIVNIYMEMQKTNGFVGFDFFHKKKILKYTSSYKPRRDVTNLLYLWFHQLIHAP